MKKLFFTDLDGTALGGGFPVYARLPNRFAAFLDDLAEQGVGWCFNTSWDIKGQWELICNSPVESRPAYLVAEFGRKIARVSGDKLELIQPYCDLMDERVHRYSDTELAPLLNKLNQYFIPDVIHSYGHLFSYTAAKAKTALTMREFADSLQNPAVNAWAVKNKLSVLPAFLGKGVPIREIMRLERLTPDDIWTAGDQLPDLDMMAPDVSKHFVCPANAPDQVKEEVLKRGGRVSTLEFAEGVMDGMQHLMRSAELCQSVS